MNTSSEKVEQRLQAVLALLSGQKAAEVSCKFDISHSDLYKFRRRALNAMREALEDQPRGPRYPANKLSEDKEQRIVALCERYPTESSYQLYRRLNSDTPDARTIQRVRERRGLSRVTKRAPTTTPARRLPKCVISRARQIIKQKPHLGPERISWDLQNGENMRISPSSVKRLKYAMHPPEPKPVWRFYERHHPHSLWHGDFMEKIALADTWPVQHALQLALLDDYSRGYVFCDLFINPDQRDVVRGLITAIRRYSVIPEVVIFDNSSPFNGRLIATFCKNVGIRLTHTAVRHPQTNGKLERAFRDDMKDFYQIYDEWHIDELRRDLPDYVHYRNTIRGHKALGGKPAITRLREQPRVAKPSPDLLDRLESLACYEVNKKVIPADGNLRMFGRNAYLDEQLAGVEITFFETLAGLEARVDDRCVGLLRDYRDMCHLGGSVTWDKALPSALYFEKEDRDTCPRMAIV